MRIGTTHTDGLDISHYKANNGPLLWGHDYESLRSVIGNAIDVTKKDKKLWATFEFHDETEDSRLAFTFYSKKIVRGFSIGFIPLRVSGGDREKGVNRIFESSELLEISATPTPCNRSTAAQYKSMGYGSPKSWRASQGPLCNLPSVIRVGDLLDVLTKPEGSTGWDETSTLWRYKVRQPSLFSEFRTIMIQPSPKVSAVYGELENDPRKWKIQSLIFGKEDWHSLSDCKAWLKRHGDTIKSFELEPWWILEEKTYDFTPLEAQKLCLNFRMAWEKAKPEIDKRMNEVLNEARGRILV